MALQRATTPKKSARPFVEDERRGVSDCDVGDESENADGNIDCGDPAAGPASQASRFASEQSEDAQSLDSAGATLFKS